MNITLKHVILIPLSCLIVSCGKNAPDPSSNEVEDALQELLFEKARSRGAKLGNEAELELLEVIKIAIDNEAQKSEFKFKIQARENSKSKWHKTPEQFTAVAYFTESGEIYIELLDSPWHREELQRQNELRQTDQMMRDLIQGF